MYALFNYRFVIENLQPNTEYSIDLVSVKGDRVSLVLRDRGTTLSETIDAEVSSHSIEPSSDQLLVL